MTASREQVKAGFIKDLQALLKKYNGATISTENFWGGYPEDGEDIRIVVDIPDIWKCGEDNQTVCIRETCTFDFTREDPMKKVSEIVEYHPETSELALLETPEGEFWIGAYDVWFQAQNGEPPYYFIEGGFQTREEAVSKLKSLPKDTF